MDCPWCAEVVELDAERCRHCGEVLQGRTAPRPRSSSPLLVILAVVGGVLALPVCCCGSGMFSALSRPPRIVTPTPPPVASFSLPAAQGTRQDCGDPLVVAALLRIHGRQVARPAPAASLDELQLVADARPAPGWTIGVGTDGKAWRAVAAPRARPGRSYAIEADGVVRATDEVALIDPSTPLPDDAAPFVAAAPPALPDGCLFRPALLLASGEHTVAGHTFVVALSSAQAKAEAEAGPVGSGAVVLLSAQHLFGDAGGLPEVPEAEVEARLARLWLLDLETSAAVASVASPGIGLPGAASLVVPSTTGDAVAFAPPDGLAMSALRLARRSPPPGAEVWLAAHVRGGAPQGQRLHRAVARGLEAGSLVYDFDDPLQLNGTSGAPLLDAAGEVVAINVGGGNGAGRGTPVESFRAPLVAGIARRAPPGPPPFAGRTFADARAAFDPALVVSGPAPQRFDPMVLPPGAREMRYRSGDLSLPAWVSDDPGDGARRPAVVYLHGGFAFDATDWALAAPLVEAGFVVVAPRLRAENGEPGAFELFGREVDDAVAAGRFAAALPYVDPDQVFVCGHSEGGTLATLCCMLPSPYRAGVSLSGAGDVATWLGARVELAPFDLASPDALALRDPGAFPGSVQVPLHLFVEDQLGPQLTGAGSFHRAARAAGRPVELRVLDGTDHWTMHEPGLGAAIPWLRARMKR